MATDGDGGIGNVVGTFTADRTNLLGWSPYGRSPTTKVEAVLNFTNPRFDVNMAAASVADNLFKNNFMPYARANWNYQGARATVRCWDWLS